MDDADRDDRDLAAPSWAVVAVALTLMLAVLAMPTVLWMLLSWAFGR